MKTFDQVKAYIKTEGEVYRRAHDDVEFDIIELDTFRQVVTFAKSEDVSIENFNLDVIIYGAHPEDEKSTVQYMHELSRIMNDLVKRDKLPKATTTLFLLWNKEFQMFED
jgi:hypothetical protein